jgi:hypothetical protein
MTSLSWRNCPALEKAVLACPYLQEVHFDECHMLSDEVLQTLGDGSDSRDPPGYLHGQLRGACPRLRCVSYCVYGSSPGYFPLPGSGPRVLHAADLLGRK